MDAQDLTIILGAALLAPPLIVLALCRQPVRRRDPGERGPLDDYEWDGDD